MSGWVCLVSSFSRLTRLEDSLAVWEVVHVTTPVVHVITPVVHVTTPVVHVLCTPVVPLLLHVLTPVVPLLPDHHMFLFKLVLFPFLEPLCSLTTVAMLIPMVRKKGASTMRLLVA